MKLKKAQKIKIVLTFLSYEILHAIDVNNFRQVSSSKGNRR